MKVTLETNDIEQILKDYFEGVQKVEIKDSLIMLDVDSSSFVKRIKQPVKQTISQVPIQQPTQTQQPQMPPSQKTEAQLDKERAQKERKTGIMSSNHRERSLQMIG